MKHPGVPQGISADLIATLEGFSRKDVDEFALSSQKKAEVAQKGGYFSKSLFPFKNPETGEVTVQRRPTTIRPWYYDSDDHYYLEVKVHNKPIELQKGKPSIDIGDKAKLPEVIETIIKATESGELDEFLLKPAVPKRAKQ